MFKEPKGIMSKERTKSLRTMSHQMKNINNEVEMIKKQQKETQELKNTITETKYSMEELNRRQKKDTVNQNIGQLRLCSLRNRKKKMQKDLWDTIKCTNISIMGVSCDPTFPLSCMP